VVSKASTSRLGFDSGFGVLHQLPITLNVIQTEERVSTTEEPIMNGENNGKHNGGRNNRRGGGRGGRKPDQQGGREGEGRGRGRGRFANNYTNNNKKDHEDEQVNKKDGRGNMAGRGGRNGHGGRGGRDGSHRDIQRQERPHQLQQQINDPILSQVSREVVSFWKQVHKRLQSTDKQLFCASDSKEQELWLSCWRAAEAGGSGPECTVDTLVKAYLKLPVTSSIHPPAAGVVTVLIRFADSWMNNVTPVTVDALIQVVRDRLMQEGSLATITREDAELARSVQELKKKTHAAVLKARVADTGNSQLEQLDRVMASDLFTSYIAAVERAVQVAATTGGAVGSGVTANADDAPVPAWLVWSTKPTVGWLMSADWHLDVPPLREVYHKGVPEYAEALLRIWTVLTFYWGSAAVWPSCSVKEMRAGEESRCGEPLMCSASFRAGVTCGQAVLQAGRQLTCGKPAQWCCRRHRVSLSLCQSCLHKGQERAAGSPQIAGRANMSVSTDIYDGVVSAEEARKEGTVLLLTQVRSRRPPQREPNWHTTYRLQCSGLVAVVPLSVRGEGLGRDRRIYWGEIVSSVPRKPGGGGGAPPRPESHFRQEGRVAVRLLGRGDLPAMQAEAEVPHDSQVAIIDLRVFVPEVVSVLATFANPQFATHLADIPFARRLIGLQASPPLLRVPKPDPNNLVGSYLWQALHCSEIHCIRMLSDAQKVEVYHDIMALAPMKTLYGTQLEAFATALSSALHCTQGPPGTGKVGFPALSMPQFHISVLMLLPVR
jgi:hypothetical protein